MVNRNLKQIADQVGSKRAPTGILPRRFKGWEFVPSLDFYVCDKVFYMGSQSWTENKLRLGKSQPMFMLNPPQFWEYYDHCKAKRPDIIEDLKNRVNEGEYLDALYYHNRGNRRIIVSPKFIDILKPKIVGKEYTLYLHKNRGFNREEIIEGGFPSQSSSGKEFFLKIPGSKKNYRPAIIHHTKNSNSITLTFTVFANYKEKPNESLGSRPCMTRETYHKIRVSK